jgi:tRNA pseudouridine38-40 synthase
LRNEDIRVMQVQKVPNDYHARYCTKERTYVYRIITSPDILSPFLKHRVWCIPRKTLNVEEMNSVANQCFLGKRDFKSFHAAKGIEYPVKLQQALN